DLRGDGALPHHDLPAGLVGARRGARRDRLLLPEPVPGALPRRRHALAVPELVPPRLRRRRALAVGGGHLQPGPRRRAPPPRLGRGGRPDALRRTGADGAPLGPRAVGRGPPSRPVLARPGVGYTWGVAPRGRPTAPGAGAPIDRRPHDGAGSRLREPLRH